jgi:hypothetical protein
MHYRKLWRERPETMTKNIFFEIRRENRPIRTRLFAGENSRSLPISLAKYDIERKQHLLLMLIFRLTLARLLCNYVIIVGDLSLDNCLGVFFKIKISMGLYPVNVEMEGLL